MQINDFPYEILRQILAEAAKANEDEDVKFTYGLSQAPLPLQQAKLQRYVRGPVKPDLQKWNAIASIRQVCPLWHEWALAYALNSIFVSKWRGGERWANLPQKPGQYGLYEMIEKPSGTAVRKDALEGLRNTLGIVTRYPVVADNVRRLWFNGFFTAETDLDINNILRNCTKLKSIAVPWTTLRHLGGLEWARILASGDNDGYPLESLELLCEVLPSQQANDQANKFNLQPLTDPRVDFSRLRKLKIFGDTTFMPIEDKDLFAIARTACNLEELYLTSISTISIDGVMALVKSSRSTLRVLEHAPRSDAGFWHPHPGSLSENEHICEILASCPRLQTVSLSVPSMCPALFCNENVLWEGDFQIRATSLCGHEDAPTTFGAHETLRNLLSTARNLVRRRVSGSIPKELAVEIFFADCIFEPHVKHVHGDFQLAEISSNGTWPTTTAVSKKGPYGSTGLYEKEEEVFSRVDEDDYLSGLRYRHVTI